MALWDILGKSLDAPLHVLLGGAVRDRVRTKFSISGTDTAGAAEIGGWAVEQGFTAMKFKVARGSVADDIERIAAVRATIGDDVRLGVDANCGWTRDAARAATPRLEDHGIAFLEQPVGLRDLAGMAELRRSVRPSRSWPTTRSARAQDALDAVRAEAADVLSVYVGMAGGVAAARRRRPSQGGRDRLDDRQQPRARSRAGGADASRGLDAGARRRPRALRPPQPVLLRRAAARRAAPDRGRVGVPARRARPRSGARRRAVDRYREDR